MYRLRYEGYGPGDSAVVVDCRSDDRDRMGSQVRDAFASHGGRLGAAGSVAYLFKEVGLLEYPPGIRSEPLVGSAWEAGAEDVVVSRKGSVQVLTDPIELQAVRSSLEQAGFQAARSGVTYRAASAVSLAGTAAADMARLIQALRGLDDVQSIYTNAEVAGEVLAEA